MSMMVEIVICDKCGGRGFEEHSELVCYHNRDYRYWNEQCPKCKGSGRVIRSLETKVEPYEPEPLY